MKNHLNPSKFLHSKENDDIESLYDGTSTLYRITDVMKLLERYKKHSNIVPKQERLYTKEEMRKAFNRAAWVMWEKNSQIESEFGNSIFDEFIKTL